MTIRRRPKKRIPAKHFPGVKPGERFILDHYEPVEPGSKITKPVFRTVPDQESKDDPDEAEIEIAEEHDDEKPSQIKDSSRDEIQIDLPDKSPIPGLSLVLGYVVSQYQLLGLVGEEGNIAHVFLRCISRHLKPQNRGHIVPQGEPGAGKSTLLRTVLKPFWSDVIKLTRMTGPGIDRREESLDGKILFLEQLEGPEPSQLKLLLSEGELSILVAERDPQSGKWVSQVHPLKGMPVFATALVGAEIQPQLLDRVATCEMDESEKQTEKIKEKKLKDWATITWTPEWKILGPLTWLDGKCRELGPFVEAVKIPFAEQFGDGIPNVLPIRRGVDRIMSLTANVAFFKAALGLRPTVEIGAVKGVRQTYVVALPEDVEDAKFCLGKSLTESLSHFFGRSKEIHDYLAKSSSSVTSAEVAVALKISQNRAGEYLRLLVKLGHATRTRQGREWKYSAVAGSTPQLELNATFTIDELNKWFAKNFQKDPAELHIPDQARAILTGTPSVVSVVSSSGLKDGTIEEIVAKENTIPHTVPKTGPDDYDTSTTDGTVHDLVLRTATALTKEKGQATIDDLEKMLSGKVSSDAIYHSMDILVKESLADVVDWGKWRTTRT